MPRHHASKYLGDMDCNKWNAEDLNFKQEEKMNDRIIWGNENPEGPNLDPHEIDCRCINCEIRKQEEAEHLADQIEDR